MRNIFTSCALGALGLVVAAQCAPAAHAQVVQHAKGTGWINSANAGPTEVEPGPGARSAAMNVAAGSATEVQPAVERVTAGRKQGRAPEQDHRHPTGATMLIAAVALMSAIALRRLGAGDR